jgi:hypothetical protein
MDLTSRVVAAVEPTTDADCPIWSALGDEYGESRELAREDRGHGF